MTIRNTSNTVVLQCKDYEDLIGRVVEAEAAISDLEQELEQRYVFVPFARLN